MSDSPFEPSEEDKGRKVWNEFRRLAGLALLSQATLVAGMRRTEGPRQLVTSGADEFAGDEAQEER